MANLFLSGLFVHLVVVVAAQRSLMRYSRELTLSCTPDLEEVLEGTLSSSSSVTITVLLNTSCPSLEGIQGVNVHVATRNASNSHALVVVARQGVQEKVFSWKIPYNPDSDQSDSGQYFSISRTLCPINMTSITTADLLDLDLYTSSPQSILYQVSVEVLSSYNLQLNETVVIDVEPASPQIFYFRFPDKNAAIIHLDNVTNTTEGCFILSAQNRSCPFNYLEEDIKSGGFFQTVITTTALEIHPGDLSEEVIIALIAVKCPESNNYPTSAQTFSMTIVPYPRLSEFKLAIAFPVIVFFAGIVPLMLVCTILYLFISCDFRLFCEVIFRIHRCGHWIDSVSVRNYGSGYSSMQDHGQDKDKCDSNAENGVEMEVYEKECYQIKCGRDICFPNRKYRDKHFIKEDPGEDYFAKTNRNFLFLWNTLAISIYYGLPAVQHLYTLQQIAQNTGEGDFCYFNYKCAHSLWFMTSFNNVWSNIVYLLFGGLFLVIAVIKNVTYCIRRRNSKTEHIGVPEYYGVYYAMGVLAFTQGIMSGFYHICPTRATIQYDYASMIIFFALVIVHILYKRCILLRVNAGLTSVLLAFITSLVLLGLIVDGMVGKRWEAFLDIVFSLLAMNFTAAFYFLHDWSCLGGCCTLNTNTKDKDGGSVKEVNGRVKETMAKEVKATTLGNSCCKWMKCHKGKIAEFVVGTLLNGIIAIVYMATEMKFAKAVLALFIMNCIFFTGCYFLYKIWFKELLTLATCLTGILTVVLVIPAAMFLARTEYDTNIPPAASRQKNGDCSFQGFYDIHDLWHFLSSIAMFFCYLLLLTLDDGVSHNRRKKLHSF